MHFKSFKTRITSREQRAALGTQEGAPGAQVTSAYHTAHHAAQGWTLICSDAHPAIKKVFSSFKIQRHSENLFLVLETCRHFKTRALYSKGSQNLLPPPQACSQVTVTGTWAGGPHARVRPLSPSVLSDPGELPAQAPPGGFLKRCWQSSQDSTEQGL